MDPRSPMEEPADGQSRRQYTPNLWGEFFLIHEPCTPSELFYMKEKLEVKNENVRRILLDAAASNDLTRRLDLIDTLERLGVAYHYRKEIDEMLHTVYNDKHGGSEDLYVTSLRFYLLRKHGYTISSGKKHVVSCTENMQFTLTICMQSKDKLSIDTLINYVCRCVCEVQG